MPKAWHSTSALMFFLPLLLCLSLPSPLSSPGWFSNTSGSHPIWGLSQSRSALFQVLILLIPTPALTCPREDHAFCFSHSFMAFQDTLHSAGWGRHSNSNFQINEVAYFFMCCLFSFLLEVELHYSRNYFSHFLDFWTPIGISYPEKICVKMKRVNISIF